MSSRRESLLLLGPVPPPNGGVSIHVERLARQLSAFGMSFTIINESRLGRHDLLSLRSIDPLVYIKQIAKASHVHIHSSNPWVRLVHTLAARALSRKVIQTFHSSRGITEYILGRLCANLSHQNIAVSQAVATRTHKYAVVAPAFLAPSEQDFGIDPDVACWIGAHKASGKKVICANAFNTQDIAGVEIYGLDMFLKAFSDEGFRNKNAAVICLSVSSPNPERVEYYRSLIDEYNAQQDVLLLIGHRPFLGIMSRCDVFVRPTITDGDALSVREALWLGVASVASDAAERPAGAVVFRSRDVCDMKLAIEKATAEPGLPIKEEFLGSIFAAYAAAGLRVTGIQTDALSTTSKELS